jgi:hypothetical protein
MKTLTFTLCALLLTACCLEAQQTDAAMKKWIEFMTPGEMHKMLAQDDGEWTEDITTWMAPGAPPQKMASTCVNKMIMGGRYQESKHIGTMMGMPFEGMGLTGYDNGRKLFVSTWVDNMGSGIMNLEGNWNATTKSINMKGTSTDPMTGKSMPVRQVMKMLKDSTQQMEMYMTQNGKEFKTLEIKFTRKK